MKYKVTAKMKNGDRYESPLPLMGLGYAITEANSLKKKAKVITILKDQEGKDHPDNAGKFFLHQIIK